MSASFSFRGMFNRQQGSRRNRRQLSVGVLPAEALELRTLMTASPLVELQHDATPIMGPQVDGPVSRIVNGTVTTQFPSVGLIGDRSGFHCTGTLIAPQYVLTAAHCAEGVGNTAGRFQVGGQTYSTTQVFVHPQYNSNAIGEDSANDIAIFKLDRPVTNVAPSPIYRATPAVGQLLTLVGFGGGGTGTSGHDGSFGTKRVGTTPLDRVSSKLLHWRFDNNTESNTAPGDSGGPAYITVGGVYYVAGVTSGGDRADAGIGDNSYDTRVDAYAAWIDSIVGTTTSPVTVSIASADPNAAETLTGQAANSGTFTISRTGSTAAALTVNITMSGTATNGTDYVAIPTTVTIPAGAASTTVTLNVRDDVLAEGSEGATMTIAAGAGYSIGSTASATVSIADNEAVTSNDLFANRRPLTGAVITTTGSNIGATRETGEPNVAGVSGGKSVWWTWTAPASGTVTISTSGSGFDTTLGVYRGTAVGSLTLVNSNDDENYNNGVYTSKLSFSAVAGRVYQIVVDGYDGDAGSIKLTLDQPAGRKATNGVPIKPQVTTGNSDRALALGLSSQLTRREAARADRVQTRHQNRIASLHTAASRHSDDHATADAAFSGCMGELLG